MPNRTPLFFDATTGAYKGTSSTLDNVFVAGVASGTATDLTLRRLPSGGAATVTLGAASVAYGADITALSVAPTAGTFSLANTGATTLNIGGGATTAVTIGNAAGTTTIAGIGTVAGVLNANGGSIATDDTTFNLLNTAATTINFGGGATIGINMGATGGLTTITGSARITQNLTVVGTTFTTESETVLINDNHLYLNNGYTTNSTQTGGLVVNRLPTVTTDTIGAGSFTTTTVTTVGTAFATGDIIQISAASNPANNGLFEVASHVATLLTIRGVGATVEDFTQNAFTAGLTGSVGSIFKVNVSVLRAKASGGFWEVGYGAVTGIAFSELTTGASSGWTDDGTVVRLTEATDDVAIGAATSLGKLSVHGDTAGQITQVIRMASSQTADALLIENNSGTDYVRVDSAGNILPGTDGAAHTLGSASLRFGSIYAQNHYVSNAAGDANPLILIRRVTATDGMIAFGPGGGTVVDSGLVRKGVGLLAPSNGDATGAGHFVPHSDNSSNLGTTALRFGQSIANQHNVYGAASDANPVIQVTGSGTTGRVSFGPGGATALDTSMRRTGVRILAFGDAGDSTGATLLPTGDTNGAIGTGATRWGDGQFVTFTASTSVTSPLKVLTERGADPGATADQGKLYTKDLSAITQLYYQASDGTVTQLTGAGSGTTLQAAYDASSNPATIATNATDQEVLISGTAGLRVTGTGVNATTGFGFDVNTTGGWQILGDLASVIETAASPLTIRTVTSGTMTVASAGLLDIDSGTAGVTIDSSGGGISLGAVGASDFTATTGGLTLATVTSGTLTVNAVADIDVNATTGVTVDGTAISIDGTAASNFTVTGAVDLTLSSTGGSVITTSAEAAADALRLNASNAAGGIDADAGTGGVTIDTTGAFSIDGAAASNVTVTGAGLDLTLSSSGGSVILLSTEAAADAIRLIANPAGGIDIDAGTAGITIDASGAGVSIDGTTASNFTVTGAGLTLSTVTSGAVTITSAGSLIATSAGLWDLNAGADLDIDVTGSYDMLSTGAFSIDGTGASNVTAASGNLTLSTTTTGSISIDSVAGVTLDAQGATSFVTAVTGTDTVATAFRVQNNSLTTKFSVSGNGVITLGSAATDDVVFTADVESNVLPGITATYNLGSATRRWGLFASSLDVASVGTTFVSDGVTAARVVYKNATADRVANALNTGLSTSNTIVGVARTTVGAGSDVTVDYAGVVTMESSGAIVAGNILYLDSSAGLVTATPPSASGSIAVIVGYAKTATGGGTFSAVLAPRTPFEIP